MEASNTWIMPSVVASDGVEVPRAKTCQGRNKLVHCSRSPCLAERAASPQPQTEDPGCFPRVRTSGVLMQKVVLPGHLHLIDFARKT